MNIEEDILFEATVAAPTKGVKFGQANSQQKVAAAFAQLDPEPAVAPPAAAKPVSRAKPKARAAAASPPNDAKRAAATDPRAEGANDGEPSPRGPVATEPMRSAPAEGASLLQRILRGLFGWRRPR